mmetsp:Transcript_22048/g.30632  ORF Transcript_22048/g.30632 Transcript_22048/m.30632 type:complete len:219 (-) Transcript_22048:156-812(-)
MQVLRLPMHTPSKVGFDAAKEGRIGMARSCCCARAKSSGRICNWLKRLKREIDLMASCTASCARPSLLAPSRQVATWSSPKYVNESYLGFLTLHNPARSTRLAKSRDSCRPNQCTSLPMFCPTRHAERGRYCRSSESAWSASRPYCPRISSVTPVRGVKYEVTGFGDFTKILSIQLQFWSTNAICAIARALCPVPVATHSTSMLKYGPGGKVTIECSM